MNNREAVKTRWHYLRAILIGVICILISVYVGVELRSLDVWGDAAALRKFSLLVGAIVSVLLGGLMPWVTLKKKGYVNLLWVALPVPILTGIDLLFRFFLATEHFCN